MEKNKEHPLAKVPEVTLGFWIIKIAATTLGETGGDAVSMSMNLGYLVGNGDDVNALGGHRIIPCRWYGWNQLVAAEINGMIAIQKVSTTTVATSNIPSGWKAAGKTTAKRW